MAGNRTVSTMHPEQPPSPNPAHDQEQVSAGPTRLRFRSLDPVKIRDTAIQLEKRISERFPESSLAGVAAELVNTTLAIAETVRGLSHPIRWLRVASRFAIMALVALAVSVLTVFRPKDALYSSIADYFQGLDAALNEMILLGVAIYFFLGLEQRIKRARALGSLHRLRSMAHIIDMHQLTKDPDRTVAPAGPDTASSPSRTLTPFQLTRYLDYCAEMLAVLSKLAALHAQDFNDPVTLSAVNDIENLTSDLSRKIWQKIMILDRLDPRRSE